MKKLSPILLGMLLLSSAHALETKERLVSYKLRNVDTYEKIGDTYVETSSQLDYSALIVILEEKENGALVNSIDLSEETRKNLLKAEAQRKEQGVEEEESNYKTKIQVEDKRHIIVSGADLTLLGEVPFEKTVKVRMKKGFGGKIKSLVIPSQTYESLYQSSLGIFNGVFQGMSMLTFASTGGSEGMTAEPFQLSDYKCSGSKKVLTCSYEITFAFGVKEVKLSKSEVKSKMIELLKLSNKYMEQAAADYSEGYTGYEENTYAKIREDFIKIRAEFKKAMKGYNLNSDLEDYIETAFTEIIEGSASNMWEWERSVTLKVREESNTISQVIARIIEAL